MDWNYIGFGIVGYDVQTAVDVKHRLIVAHEGSNTGSGRNQLTSTAEQARESSPDVPSAPINDRDAPRFGVGRWGRPIAAGNRFVRCIIAKAIHKADLHA